MVSGLGLRIYGLGFRVHGVWGSLWDLGWRIWAESWLRPGTINNNAKRPLHILDVYIRRTPHLVIVV